MCIQWTRVLYSVVITYDSLIHIFHNSTVRAMYSRVSGQCLYTIDDYLCLNTTTNRQTPTNTRGVDLIIEGLLQIKTSAQMTTLAP